MSQEQAHLTPPSKEAEATNEHAGYLQPNGQNGTDLGRQLSITLTPQQFEGTSARE